MNTSSTILKIFRLVTEEKKKLLLLITLALLVAGSDLAAAFISQHLIDGLINFFQGSRLSGGTIFLILSSGGIIAATIGNRIFKSLYNYRLFKRVTAIEDDTKNRAFSKYLQLHPLYHHDTSGGQIIGRIDRGASALFAILYDILGQNLIPSFLIFFGVCAALVIKNPLLALIVLLPLPLYLIAIQKLTAKIYAIENTISDQFEAVAKESYDIAGNVLTVKKFSREWAESTAHRRLLKQARHNQYAAERLWATMENIQTFIGILGKISIMIIAGLMTLKGRVTVGEFILYMTLQNMAYSPISQLSTLFPRFRRQASRLERLFALLEEPLSIVDKPGALALSPLREKVEYRNISFGYKNDGIWALKNINVTIPAGKTVALVGPSGSGKTTFANLLLRSFDPQLGEIYIDGINIKNVTQESLRGQIAVVPQEVELFSRTIAENIAYGRPGAGREDIVRAAKTALAHGFIEQTENGYDTLVGQRGMKLSGGQRQRIGIARAVLRDPRILIFDEATSHLDTESERLIAQATEALSQNRTSIIIAHRLSTILHADLIIVFNNHRVEAVGTLKKLLHTSPTFQTLFKMPIEKAARA